MNTQSFYLYMNNSIISFSLISVIKFFHEPKKVRKETNSKATRDDKHICLCWH